MCIDLEKKSLLSKQKTKGLSEKQRGGLMRANRQQQLVTARCASNPLLMKTMHPRKHLGLAHCHSHIVIP